MSAIGVIGGMGPQASARLYNLLIEGSMEFTDTALDEHYPEIVILSVPVPDFVRDDKAVSHVKKTLIKKTKLLEEAGCGVNGIACNTAHIMLPDLQACTDVPFLSLPVLVAQRAQEKGFKRVGLFASIMTLNSSLYDDAFDGVAELVKPAKKTAQRLNTLIYKQLNNDISLKDKKKLRSMAKQFMHSKGLDVVVLGCTELPLVYGESDSEKVIDTLQVLSDGLLKHHFLTAQGVSR